jgi:hypothetical protein
MQPSCKEPYQEQLRLVKIHYDGYGWTRSSNISSMLLSMVRSNSEYIHYWILTCDSFERNSPRLAPLISSSCDVVTFTDSVGHTACQTPRARIEYSFPLSRVIVGKLIVVCRVWRGSISTKSSLEAGSLRDIFIIGTGIVRCVAMSRTSKIPSTPAWGSNGVAHLRKVTGKSAAL